MVIARINTVGVARIQWSLQGTQDYCLRPIILSSFHALTTERTYRETQSDLNASLPEGMLWFLRNWKVHGAPEVMDANLKNLWCISLKTASPGQPHVFLQVPLFNFFFFNFRVCKSIFKADMEQQISLKAIMYPGISIKKLPNDIPVDSLEVQLETENNDQKKSLSGFVQ